MHPVLTRRPLLALPALLLAGRARGAAPLFPWGVASGDPRPDGAVLWTRLDPPAGAPVEVTWEVAADQGFRRILQRGVAEARAAEAHSLHLEPAGLPPDRPLWFRFRAQGQESAVGRTRTAPPPGADAAIRFLNAGCQNFEHGFYTAWAHAAAMEGLHFIFHYGDSIYEGAGRQGPGGWGPLVRPHLGGRCRTLADYRARHAQYLSDADWQAARAAHPLVCSADDHEVDNNWAGDHTPRPFPEDGFPTRRDAALQAWWEHMPLPRAARTRAFRRLRFGRHLTLHVLDTRRHRSPQACGDGARLPCAEWSDPARTMLGAAQEGWLAEGLALGDGWQVLAQQVMLAHRLLSGDRLGMDAWDGYPAARARLLGLLRGHDAAVLTGDVHRAWACDVAPAPGAAPVAAEFVATSISSEGDGSPRQAGAAEVMARNPWMKLHSNLRGFTWHEARAAALEARFLALPYVTRPGAPLEEVGRAVALRGRPGVETA
ncbi:alkaline phosphatase D family protein [Roseococcus sp. DSY-14]|uniref:alkaline phosphatase D family protein n=1 Tax=Roseococcus sp. DSY-14 TaxID=3369650 RepID=UPI00387AFB6A